MKRSRLIRFFARRYLFSKKSHSVVNVISVVSALSLAVPTAAMIILLSVHNGLNDFISSLNSTFEPDLKILPVNGKYFAENEIDVTDLCNLEGVAAVSKITEEDVLIERNERQRFMKMRGTDSRFTEVVPIDTVVIRGNYDPSAVLMGLQTAYDLGMAGLYEKDITVYTIRDGEIISFLPSIPYNKGMMRVSGIFSLDMESENRYVLAPLEELQRLNGRADAITSIFVKTDEATGKQKTKSNIIKLLDGKKFRVLTQEEEKGTQYNIMRQEKFAIYLILLLVLAIASFTLIGAIIMLIIEKKDDNSTLAVMGLNDKDIRRIFMTQGMYIAVSGIAAGTVIGLGISLMQQKLGLVKIAGTSPLIDSYPVAVSYTDTLLVVATVLAVSYLVAAFTVRSMLGTKK